MTEEVESLENDADAFPNLIDIPLRVANQDTIFLPIADKPTVDVNATSIVMREEIDTSKQRGLSGSTGANNRDRFTPRQCQVDVSQGDVTSECFSNVYSLKDALGDAFPRKADRVLGRERGVDNRRPFSAQG